MVKRVFATCLCSTLAYLFLPCSTVSGSSLPKSTQEMVKQLKIDASILEGVDQELRVPAEWIEKAKNEKQLRIYMVGMDENTKRFLAPFRERYPFISNMALSSPTRQERSVKTLMAYKHGNILTDVINGIGGTFNAFKEAGALENLKDLPNFQRLAEGFKDPAGLWVGITRNYMCMAYNTKLVKKEDLPTKWEDLLTNPSWRKGNLALANKPNQWALQLWQVKGERWVKDYLTRLFTEVRPQLRKEGMGAVTELTAAGEFHAVLVVSASSAYELFLKGAPMGYHCPDPAPAASTEGTILKGSPNVHTAKLFLNWLVSKEGQLAQYATSQSLPSRDEVMRPEFVPFQEGILGRKVAFRDPGLETEVMPKLEEFWNNLWLRGQPR